jgi:hypothetical protein
MSFRPPQPTTGHVFRREGARRPVWYAKYRLPDGRQVQRSIGPAWTERGRPGAGYFTRRTAQAWLDQVLADARRGELAGMVRTGATFADAVAEYMRWLEQDRARKPTTLRGYESIMRAHLLPAFGERRLEDIAADEVEVWSATLAASGMANSTRLRILTCLFGVMKRAKRVWKLPRNPISDVEKADAAPRRDRAGGLLARGDSCAGARGRVGAGRGDLPDRRVHGPAPRRARGAALALRRLRA